jgi:hypothetical protein
MHVAEQGQKVLSPVRRVPRPAYPTLDTSKDVPPKAGKPSEPSSTAARVTTLGKSVRININATAITPPSSLSLWSTWK